MDPLTILSAVASIIGIAQGLGSGIRVLRSMANASIEFCDMLNEILTLHGLLAQLEEITDNTAETKLLGSVEALNRLKLLELELKGLVDGMNDMVAKLLNRNHTSVLFKRKPGISRTGWHLARGRVLDLRNRAKDCRMNLTACLALLGFSKQLEQGMLVCEIRGILETSRKDVGQLLDTIRATTKSEHSFTQSVSTHLNTRFDALEAQLSTIIPRQRPKLKPTSSGTHPTTNSVGASMIHIQGFLREPCGNKQCNCQCHRISTCSTPLWAEPIIGALILRYNGPTLFGAGLCDVQLCGAGGKRSVSLGYTFPTWLVARAISISACWGSLTNAGAWLHLVVPRVASPPGIWRAVMYGDLVWIWQKIATKEFLPTDIEVTGEGYLSHILRYRRYDVVAFLLDMGFSPSFVDSSGGSAITIARMQLSFDEDLSPDVLQLLQRIVGADENQWPTESIPTVTKDSAIENINTTLIDAFLAPPSLINTLDEFGYTSLHWAAERGYLQKSATLIRQGATVDVEAARHRKAPLHLAAFRGFPRIISLLLENGANINTVDFRRYTPLHCGIKHLKSVRTLLNAGANPNAQSVTGATPLHLAASMSFGSHIETIYGPSVTSEAESLAAQLSSPEPYLGFECPDPAQMEPNDVSGEIMTELVQQGADCEIHDYDGMTPLMFAAAVGNISAVYHLHNIGARLDIVAQDGMTVLDYAAIYRGRDLMDCLRTMDIQGIDPDTPHSTFGHSTLSWFEQRMSRPWLPGQTKPTQADVFAFYASVYEMRQRNWRSGLFLTTRAKLMGNGHQERLRKWLAIKGQELHDDPARGERDCTEDDRPGLYDDGGDFDALSGIFDTTLGDIDDSESESSLDEHGQIEEFFDALE